MDTDALTRERLINLLDYIAQQSQDINLNKYEIHQPAITLADLTNALGVSIKSSDQSIWFEVTRLKLTPCPIITENIRPFITFLAAEQPVLDIETLKSKSLKFLPSIQSSGLRKRLNGERLLAKIAYCKQIQQQVTTYLNLWQSWQNDAKKIRKSIEIYDLLFSWKTNVSLAISNRPAEIVAGVGIMGWQLPSTGHRYVYPLITQQVDIEILSNGVIQVMAVTAKPQLEMAAFMAQEALPQAPDLNRKLKQQLYDGREIHIFDPSSYQDIVQAAVMSLDSQGSFIAEQVAPTVRTHLTASLAWSIFSRPRISSVIEEDIDKLKQELEQGAEIFEQPRTLVQEAALTTREQPHYVFRGRSGIEVSADIAQAMPQELFFPLPYNKEQVTIVQQLIDQAGVVVQGPPGTGKTHTIANIICHYLAQGKRVLVTAQQGHVLKTVQEKIPESIRPLVVSRVGTHIDSRRQLESSIDIIVQNLSQLNITEVQASIQKTLAVIDSTHQAMTTVDRQIYNFAEAHYTDITIDGKNQRAVDIADLVVEGETHYQWFNDQLSLAVQHQFPLNTEALMALRRARRQVGQHLAQREQRLPASNQLPNPLEIATLHQTYQRLAHIEKAIEKGEQWQAIEHVEETRFIAFKQSLQAALQQHEKLDAAQQGAIWLMAFRNKLHDPHLKQETEILKKLFADIEQLIELRALILSDPVEIPLGFYSQSKASEALQRAVETGKPFMWFYFAGKEIEDIFANIRVSGRVANQPELWQQVKRYIDGVNQAQHFSVRWNNIAPLLELPTLTLHHYQLDPFLRELERIYRTLNLSIILAEQYDSLLYQQYQQLYRDKLPSNFFYVSANIHQGIVQVDAYLDLKKLSVSKQTLTALRHYLSGYDHPRVHELLKFMNELGDQACVSDKLSRYQQLITPLQTLEQLASAFEVINTAVTAIADTGAYQLSERIGRIVQTEQLQDNVLPDNLLDAWQWARLKQHLNDINHRQALLALNKKRKELEQILSSSYEQVVAQQAWLSLKKSASDLVLTALQRYKTAIQKIGKGTGKNASRYRKDAQSAMLQAAEAIPCWVMTHYQVSESMPARLGVFDLIIVDEASQSTLEALPVLMRGKKLLVVGDDKQVSPSNVGLASEHINLLRNKYLSNQPHAAVLTPDMSLYDIASSIYPSIVMLLEHFRCHPAIIAYSNQHFYSNKIKPMRLSKQSERLSPALISIYTPDGAREETSHKKINRTEAEAIIHEMARIMADAGFQGRSLGVISLLGNEQAAYIQTRALDTFGAELLTRFNFASGDASAFQGAERDIIFLSMVADPNNCHPLSRREHEQRLNVAASRARERMYLVHSVTLTHLSPKDLRVGLLSQYFIQADQVQQSIEKKLALCESGFEKEVLSELLTQGYQVTPQLKVGSYRIDLVVVGEKDARLAVECDGDSFHGPEQWTADMQRQRALERAGWTFWRCFASTWRLEKEAVLTDLFSTLTRMNIHPQTAITGNKNEVENREWRDTGVPLPDFTTNETSLADSNATDSNTSIAIEPKDQQNQSSNLTLVNPSTQIMPIAIMEDITLLVSHKTCVKCQTEKQDMDFSNDSYYADGLSTWCKHCLSNTKKWCVHCNVKKQAMDFVQNHKRPDGLAKFCKVCTDRLLRG
jgi:very-short-patch-repair endonuclease